MALDLNNCPYLKTQFLVVWLLAGMTTGIQAVENLPDPTRPPDVYSAAGEGLDVAASPVAELQTIVLSSTRKIAVISGQTVALGGKFGDARLIKLSPNEAVLRNENGLLVLKLLPDVEKKMRVVSPGESNVHRGTSKADMKKKVKQ